MDWMNFVLIDLIVTPSKYTLDIISEVGLLDAKPDATLLDKLLSNPEQYSRLVARLIYLCFARPKLSYSAHTLS